MRKYKNTAIILIMCMSLIFVSSCDKEEKEPSSASAEPSQTEQVVPTENEEKKELTGADKYLSEMSLKEKIYQMFFVNPEAITGVGITTAAGETTQKALKKYPVGGIIYFADNIETPEQIKEMIKNSQEFSKIPLFIGVDEEGGKVTRISQNEAFGVKKIPAMKSIGNTSDLEEAREVAREAGGLLKEYGFNVNFAPVADVYDENAQNEIGTRAFSGDAALNALMVSAYVEGIAETGVASMLKHFPGNGSAEADSHNGYAQVSKTYDEFNSVDFEPFRAGIDAGADFVLVGHTTAVNLDSENKPSSVSYRIISELLKGELGFDGIVITDSMQMGAITDEYSDGRAAAESIIAGADMVLMMPDIESAYDAVINAVENGEITEEQIDESVRKIINKKIEMGIVKD